ncbi:MAG: hypothetical protein C5B52_11955 [Bacteroidetes bacterium]|nr:MAG: hypothetical protein C5B52_11955 [Bacteroidota bacterium]
MSIKMTAIALTAVFTMGISQHSFAETGTAAELVFIGNNDNAPVFQLNLNNAENGEFVVTIKDASDKVLYSEKLSGEKITRRYKLDAEESELIAGTTFEITNKATNETSVYRIDKKTKVIQEVVVAKL